MDQGDHTVPWRDGVQPGCLLSDERLRSEPDESPPSRVLQPERVADFIPRVATPPEFVLAEGIIVTIEEGLP